MTTRLAAGEAAPAFSLPDAQDKTVSLSDFAGKRVVVYFYPAAMTPGCTTQAVDFTAADTEFDVSKLDVLPQVDVAYAYANVGDVAVKALVAAGALPPGLTLSSAGVLSGAPTTPGTYNFSLTAADSSGAPGPFVSAPVAYSLAVAAPTISFTSHSSFPYSSGRSSSPPASRVALPPATGIL